MTIEATYIETVKPHINTRVEYRGWELTMNYQFKWNLSKLKIRNFKRKIGLWNTLLNVVVPHIVLNGTLSMYVAGLKN